VHVQKASNWVSSIEAAVGGAIMHSTEGQLTVWLTTSEATNSSNIGSSTTSRPTCVAFGHGVSINESSSEGHCWWLGLVLGSP
jgi:hypothetical protein